MFDAMTPRELYHALKEKGEMMEAQMKIIYQAARLSGWLSVLPHTDKDKPEVKPEDLVRFKWEREVNAAPQSVEQMKTLLLGIAAASKKRK